MTERMGELSRRLAEVLWLLGFDGKAALEKGEETDAIYVTDEAWPAERAASLSPEPLLELAKLCQGALTLSFQIGGAESLSVTPATGLPDFDRLRDEAKQYAGPLTVQLLLDKKRLLATWGVQAPHTVVKLFLRHQALARALRVPLEELEGGLFAGSDGSVKLLILVADRPFSLDGPYLAVVGERCLPDWRRSLPAAPPDPAPVRAMLDEAVRSLHWISFRLSRLTPLQLEVRWTDGTPDGPWNPAVQALYEKLLALSLVYTASQTSRPKGGDELVCVFESGGRNAEVRIPDGQAEATDLWRAPDGQNRLDAIATLAGATRWAYGGDRGSDRLTVWQRVVAEDLHGNLPAANHRFAVQRASTLERHAEWSWQAFVEGKLDTYFDRVEKLEKAVDETAGKLDEQIRNLNKAFFDSMLATIGAVAASFLVAIFRKDSPVQVLRFGFLIYAAYLLVFPGALGLLAARLQFKETWDAFQDRLWRGFGERLYKGTVQSITGDRVTGAGRRFKGWWWVTLAAYLLIIAALCVAAWKAPALMPPPPPRP